jgi:succinyl-CoA synthetase beta subunit
MDLLEYQAKELFRQNGIPVLPSQRIDHCKDLKDLKLSYPIVLKSQVYTGGRGKAGGIKFVENTIDAIAVAQTIFNLPIMGQYPEVLLAEAKYDSDRELYLAVVLDCDHRYPVLLGSQEGGIDTELIFHHMQQVIVDQEFSPFYARRLALKLGLRGELIQSVSSIIEKMYRLFTQKDLDLVEINPLAVSPTGELMALDGKIIVNDDALGRHSDLAILQSQLVPHIHTQLTLSQLKLVELEGNIGVLCNGTGLSMATLDLIQKAGGRPAGLVNLGREWQYSESPIASQTAIASQLPLSNQPPFTAQEWIEQGLELIVRVKGVKVIFVNLFSSIVSCLQIAEAIKRYLQRQPYSHRVPLLVVRLVGNQFEQAQVRLATIDVPLLESLDSAIAQTVALSKSKLS